MRELSLLAEALYSLDNDPEFLIRFWTEPHVHARIVNNLLKEQIHKTAIAGDLTVTQTQNYFDQAYSRLLSEFWDHTWPAHDCHFHKSFEEFCNCPFTCLTELADCVSGIARRGA